MTLPEKIKKYGLTQKDWFQHKHYTIVTRMGIDKIQAIESININFESITSTPEFCVIKAIGVKDKLRVETFGSAKYGAKVWDNTLKNGQGGWDEQGNCTTWYIAEMAEKRAMSRVVLKITGFYELGVFGEDESEDFKNESPKQEKPTEPIPTPKRLTPDQVAKIPTTEVLSTLMTILSTYTLQPTEKTAINKRIKELKK